VRPCAEAGPKRSTPTPAEKKRRKRERIRKKSAARTERDARWKDQQARNDVAALRKIGAGPDDGISVVSKRGLEQPTFIVHGPSGVRVESLKPDLA
jgi:hypothetical protein